MYRLLFCVLSLVVITACVSDRTENKKNDTVAADSTQLSQQAKASGIHADLQDGDIIFQLSLSPQSRAVAIATSSQYTHMGIVMVKDGKFVVYEASDKVKTTPLAKWIKKGKDGKYVIKRLQGINTKMTTLAQQKFQAQLDRLLGNPYDPYFQWTDNSVYCSELVWKVYDRALNVQLVSLSKLGDYKLNHPTVKTLLAKRYGNNIPVNEKVIAPSAIFESKLLVTISEN